MSVQTQNIQYFRKDKGLNTLQKGSTFIGLITLSKKPQVQKYKHAPQGFK